MSSEMYDVVVIGAGQAGLAAGYHLRASGLRFLLLEAASVPGGSWPRYYASLRLFSPARFSSLPGWALEGDRTRYPVRDEIASYLRAYAERFDLPIRTHARVERVVRRGNGFELRIRDASPLRTRALVAATGTFEHPFVPEIEGRASFRGRTLHSCEYLEPSEFRGQRVVIVGGGNSAVQIGVELARSARVTLATRRPIRWIAQRVLGRSLHFWLDLTGLDRSRWLDGADTTVIDQGGYREAVEGGRPERRPMFERFTEHGLEWKRGEREPVDSVIFATGFRPALAYLSELAVFDARGRVQQRSGASTTTPGLYFVGLVNQTCYRSASLRGVGADAERVVRRIGKQLVERVSAGVRVEPAARPAAGA